MSADQNEPRHDVTDNDLDGAIAIIGLAGRFPGAANPQQLWRNLREGVESITVFSEEELRREGVPQEMLDDPAYVRAKAVVEGAEFFDAGFFGFTPREAELTDPQHRFFLECAHEALENAGYDPARFDGAIGLFGGAGVNSYLMLHLLGNPRLAESAGLLQTLIHNKNDHLCTRVGYKLDLGGPCVTVQTACSTSLVATGLACQSLLDYQCDMALAGGSTIVLPQRSGYLYQEGGIASPDGHCRAFDAKANGTVDGNGTALVVLKRLEDALADGDTVRAVIRGWAINNDGSRKAGYTAPSVERQAEVIATAQGLAGVTPDTIGYIEAHGTGTNLGDPIELAALTQAFRRDTDASDKRGFCAVGSVKSNFGHLDTAAGVTGLIKTTLALEHGEIPPSLHYESAHPAADLENSPFYIASELAPWPVGDHPRRAGVSSFGIGGTNAHLVLEEAPAPRLETPSARPWQVLLLSARSTTALEVASERLAADLNAMHEDGAAAAELADIAHTLQVGRRRFAHRRMVLCRDLGEAVEALDTLDPERVFTRTQDEGERPVVFMFPGQGTQHPGMGASLYRDEPVFRDALDRCAERLHDDLGLDLRQLLYPAEGAEDEAVTRLRETRYTQPALFAVEYALARLWLSWGLEPKAMTGHSIGEYVAACLAGVMSLEQALPLVAARGRLIQSLPKGAMLSIARPEKDVVPHLGETLSLAAVNGPSLSVVAGDEAAIDALAADLDRQSITVRKLHTSHAFHSQMMDPILDAFAAEVRKVDLHPPSLPLISNVTGTWMRDEDATDPDYWVRHLRHTVRFSDGVERLLEEPNVMLLEVGPGRTLKTVTRWHPKKTPDQLVETSLPHPGDPIADDLAIHSAVGRLALAGVEVDWTRYHGGSRRRVPLPTYPFEHRRYWIEAPAPGRTGAPVPTRRSGGTHLDRLEDLADWFYAPAWHQSPPLWLEDTALNASTGDPWLLFVDELGVGERMAARLEKAGAQVVRVARERGSSVNVTDDGTRYTIDPAEADALGEVFADLRRHDIAPRNILHLWGLTADTVLPAGGRPTRTDDTRSAWQALQDRVFYSLIYLAQAGGLGGGASDDAGGVRLLAVTDGLQSVAGEAAPQPEKATLIGALKVLPREFPGVVCRALDVATADLEPPRLARLADAVLAEALDLGRTTDQETATVAIRGGQRFTQHFEPLQLTTQRLSKRATAGLREGGCYLITGGLGGVGLEVAELLAREARARLVLLGRSPLPPREAWEASSRGGGIEARKIRRLLRLEESGAEILTLAADVTDADRLADAVVTARERFGRIDGVFHAAGIAGGGLVQLRSKAAARSVFAPKINGARALEAALADDLPELWVFFSSLSAVVGRLGQVDYGAANAFLGAHAHDLARRTGVRAVAVDWGEWLETGMAASHTLDGDTSPADALEVEHLDHPMLERRTVLPSGEEIYATEFDVHKHWVVDEHRLVGNPVIPGVAYIEMVRAAIGDRADGKMIELHDLFFVAPLRVRDDQTREVRLRLRPDDEATSDIDFRFSIESDADEDEDATGVREYALGQIKLVEPTPIETLDLEAIKADCSARVSVFHDEEREDDLGPRWQNVQRAHVGHNQVLTHLGLPEDFAGDFEIMKYHPSMMDRAAGVAKEYLYEGTYLPLAYKLLRIKGPIPRHIYTWARHFPEVDPSLETLTFNTRVMDLEGRVLVEFDGFSQKLVTDAAVKIKSYAGHGDWGHTVARRDDSAEARQSQEMRPEEGAEALRRILAGPDVARIAVSVRDLDAVLARAGESAQDRVLEETERQRQSGPARANHPRPELPTAYTPPRNDVERQLVAVWQEMLGIEPVGVDDDFFQLGGDSVQAIQIIAAIGKVGIELTPQQFFQHGTIAQLAELAGATGSDTGTGGPLVLTASQAMQLERHDQHPDAPGWLFTARGDAEPEILRRAVRHLVTVHAMFGLRLERGDDGPVQSSAVQPSAVQHLDETADVPFRAEDLRGAGADARAAAIADAGEAARRGFDPESGPVARWTYLRDDEGGTLLLGLHPLVADRASWPIVLADLESLYDAIAEGREPALPPDGPALRRVVEAEANASQKPSTRAELDDWRDAAPATTAPAKTGEVPDESLLRDAVRLPGDAWRALRGEVERVYKADAEATILAALEQALELQGADATLVARDARQNHDDLARVVASLETVLPVPLVPSRDFAEAVPRLKEALRRGEDGGAGYGRLRYLSDDPEIRQALGHAPRLRVQVLERHPLEGCDSTRFHNPQSTPPPLASSEDVAVLAEFDESGLQVDLQHRLSHGDAEALGQGLAEALRQLQDHCRGSQEAGFTPSDFPLAGLDDSALSQLADLVGAADDDEGEPG